MVAIKKFSVRVPVAFLAALAVMLFVACGEDVSPSGGVGGTTAGSDAGDGGENAVAGEQEFYTNCGGKAVVNAKYVRTDYHYSGEWPSRLKAGIIT